MCVIVEKRLEACAVSYRSNFHELTAPYNSVRSLLLFFFLLQAVREIYRHRDESRGIAISIIATLPVNIYSRLAAVLRLAITDIPYYASPSG